MIDLGDSGVLLFQGDSITDAGRKESQDGLGSGYVSIISGTLGADPRFKGLSFLNRGVSGDRTVELLSRWKEDCLDLKPSALSIMYRSPLELAPMSVSAAPSAAVGGANVSP